MRIPALIHNLKKNEKKQVQKCLEAYKLPVKLVDILQADIKKLVRANQILITFGTISASIVEAEFPPTPPILIKLPHPKKILNLPANIEARRETAKKLKELTKLVADMPLRPEQINVSEEDLPLLEDAQVLLLDRLTTSGSSLIVAKNGALVEIGPEKKHKTDIFLTVEELFLIRKTMNTLDVSEIQLYRSTECSTEPSKKSKQESTQ
jgi:hypothetical protein